jgi:imidazoleglycerol phosphate synthase glutamine amidotransferase subunit HisH
VIVVVDYGVNNLASVVRALAAGGHAASLTSDPEDVRRADHVVMPGVGHFGQAARTLESTGLGPAVRDAAARGHPVMGICLGLQLFFGSSAEAPEAQASAFSGHVVWRRDRAARAARRVGPGGSADAGAPPGDRGRVSRRAPGFFNTCTAITRPTGWSDARHRPKMRLCPTIVGRDNVPAPSFTRSRSGAGIELLDAFARWRP